MDLIASHEPLEYNDSFIIESLIILNICCGNDSNFSKLLLTDMFYYATKFVVVGLFVLVLDMATIIHHNHVAMI